VYDCFIAATTLYKQDRKSDGTATSSNVNEGRAQVAPTIQKHFERPGPLKDPRYNMIDHLAPKFRSATLAKSALHEPRAAFLLNRFSETLPIMYATHAAEYVLSCNPDDAVGRSFYEFIDEGYLLGAVNAIERAKENDSIAYMRLLWKGQLDDGRDDDEDTDEEEENDEDEKEERNISMGDRIGQPDGIASDGERYEVECLLSASSDGLIVVVRRAPPLEGVPPAIRPPGIFASPWATSPLPPFAFTPPPPSPVEGPPEPTVVENIPAVPRPSDQQVMNSIRDVSVFAWSIAMLNDTVSQDNMSTMVDGEIYPEEENVRATDVDRWGH